MTTLNEARQAVYRRFADEWTDGAAPLTPFQLDNETFVPPSDAQGHGLPWAQCLVRSIAGTQETLGVSGNRKYKRRAMVLVKVYDRPGTGTSSIDAKVEKAKNIFEGFHLAGTSVKVYGADIAELGIVDDGRWNLSTMQAYFDYEEVK